MMTVTDLYFFAVLALAMIIVTLFCCYAKSLGQPSTSSMRKRRKHFTDLDDTYITNTV